MWIVWIVDFGLWIVTGLRSQLSAQSVRAERGEGKVPMGECGAGREGKERVRVASQLHLQILCGDRK